MIGAKFDIENFDHRMRNPNPVVTMHILGKYPMANFSHVQAIGVSVTGFLH